MTQSVSTSPSFTFICSLSNGIHARPASHLAELASTFASECVLTNTRNNATANVKSVLAIISSDVRLGDRCLVQANGPDEHSAHAALQHLIGEVLPGCDVPLATVVGLDRNQSLPRVLQTAGVSSSFGLPVSGGFVRGKVVIVSGMTLPRTLQAKSGLDAGWELERLQRALTTVRSRIREKVAHAISPTAAAILQADLAIAGDVSFAEKLAEHILQGESAGQAVMEGGEFFMSVLRRSESVYTRERASDIQEICLQLLDEIYGAEFRASEVELHEPSVVVAESLAPQQLLGLDRYFLRAVVLEHSGTTSHAVILAHSLGIPLIVGVKNARVSFSPGQEVVVDANRGFVVPCAANTVKKFYEREVTTIERRCRLLARYANGPATTSDGKTLDVSANASSCETTERAFAEGADGIGLFRTEMLFLGREAPPSEDEQFAIYAEVARIAAGRPVIIRTFDIGADKPAPFLGLAPESNPFLGYRGVRLYAEHKELVQSQMRAILRASSLGRIQIMVPMVSSLEEVLEFKAMLLKAAQSLTAIGVAIQHDILIGIMIEVPSAAFILNELSTEIDYFSIGTNDLSQYFFAADRGNSKIAGLSNVRHPSFLRFLKQTVDQIRRAGKWVGMCGEMAADIRALPLLLGLGLDEISLPSAQIPEFKRRISGSRIADCHEILNRAIACTSPAEVDELLGRDQFSGAGQPLLSEDMIVLESNSESKEEAIQEIVDAFYVAGRIEDRYRLEEALWAREAVYSTGLGYGFAVPHCKTEAIASDSIGILRLNRPIEWGSVDGKPVHMVVLIALRDLGSPISHMQVLSKVARKLMDEEFRTRLLAVKTPPEAVACLVRQLE